MKSPVLFLIFNRPDTTERVFEEIRKARPPRLYVAADGPEGIIIEDDILPHPDFFTYCDELLGRYRDDERIQLVTGHNAFYKGFVSEYSYHMSSFFHIWGWASWRQIIQGDIHGKSGYASA